MEWSRLQVSQTLVKIPPASTWISEVHRRKQKQQRSGLGAFGVLARAPGDAVSDHGTRDPFAAGAIQRWRVIFPPLLPSATRRSPSGRKAVCSRGPSRVNLATRLICGLPTSQSSAVWSWPTGVHPVRTKAPLHRRNAARRRRSSAWSWYSKAPLATLRGACRGPTASVGEVRSKAMTRQGIPVLNSRCRRSERHS